MNEHVKATWRLVPTGDGSVVGAPFRKVAPLAVLDRVLHLLAVGSRLELHGGTGLVIRMVLVQPGAARDVVAATVLHGPSAFRLVVPVLAALEANVTGPRATLGLVMHLDGDPGDTHGILCGGDTDILGAGAPGVLVNGEVVNVTGLDVGSTRLAEILVVGVPGISGRNIALL